MAICICFSFGYILNFEDKDIFYVFEKILLNANFEFSNLYSCFVYFCDRASSLLSSLGEKLNIFSGSRSVSKSRSVSSSVANNTRQAESRGSIDREKVQLNNLHSTTTSSAPKFFNRAPSGQPAYTLQDRKSSRSKRGLPPDFENNLESEPVGNNSEYSNGRVLSSEMIDENHVNHAGDYESSYQKHNSRMRGKVSGRGDEGSEVKDDEISSTTTEESNAESEYSERSSKQVSLKERTSFVSKIDEKYFKIN